VGTVIDVTERNAAEEKIREQEWRKDCAHISGLALFDSAGLHAAAMADRESVTSAGNVS